MLPNLSSFDPLQTYTVQIVDLKGVAQGSYTLKGQKSQLNLEHLAAGIYALHLKSSDNTISQRIKLSIIK